MADIDRLRQREGITFFLLYAGSIPLSNWLIGNVGTTCVADGPCLIPVAPGLVAPSGVLAVGLALILRDIVQRRLGITWSVVAIVLGAALSASFAPPALVVASTTAFLLSEFADLAVYTPLQRRRFMCAVIASSIVGLVVDSMVFLWLAFGTLDFLAGQVVGKTWMVLAALPILAWLRSRYRRLRILPA